MVEKEEVWGSLAFDGVLWIEGRGMRGHCRRDGIGRRWVVGGMVAVVRLVVGGFVIDVSALDLREANNALMSSVLKRCAMCAQVKKRQKESTDASANGCQASRLITCTFQCSSCHEAPSDALYKSVKMW